LCATLVACDRSEQPQNVYTVTRADHLRIVTLSPHLAELVFAVGAGDQLVGVSAYTDYPEAAMQLPVVGDAFNIDQEQLAVLAPDLLLAWDTGTPVHVADRLRSRGYRVEFVSTTNLFDVSAALKQIGQLTGHEDTAKAVSADFDNGFRQLADERYQQNPVRVFYQVAARPLYTINGDHYLSQLIEICGGVNIFADLSGLAPLVSVESVLRRDPEIMLAATDAGVQAFDAWQRWSDMAAIRYDNQFLMPANEIGRATPRLLIAARALCDALEQGRRNREIMR
jgi:iron complex transport system substrate-binding protein